MDGLGGESHRWRDEHNTGLGRASALGLPNEEPPELEITGTGFSEPGCKDGWCLLDEKHSHRFVGKQELPLQQHGPPRPRAEVEGRNGREHHSSSYDRKEVHGRQQQKEQNERGARGDGDDRDGGDNSSSDGSNDGGHGMISGSPHRFGLGRQLRGRKGGVNSLVGPRKKLAAATAVPQPKGSDHGAYLAVLIAALGILGLVMKGKKTAAQKDV